MITIDNYIRDITFNETSNDTTKERRRECERLQSFVSMLPISVRSIPKPFTTYVDLGSGDGKICQQICEYFNITAVYPFDVESNSDSVIIYNGRNLPIQCQSIDLMTCFMSLHHIEPLKDVLLEMERVCHIGSYLFIREHDISNENDALYVDLIHLIHQRLRQQKSTFLRYLSRDNLRKLLITLGFQEVATEYYDDRSNPQRIYSSLYYKQSLIDLQKFNEINLSDISVIHKNGHRYGNVLSYFREHDINMAINLFVKKLKVTKTQAMNLIRLSDQQFISH